MAHFLKNLSKFYASNDKVNSYLIFVFEFVSDTKVIAKIGVSLRFLGLSIAFDIQAVFNQPIKELNDYANWCT
jgi:hypothetical protein